MSAPFCKTSYLRAFGGVLADVYDETGKQFYKVPPRPKITFQRVVEALADAEWRIKIGDTFPLEETLEPPDETDLKIVWAARKKEIEDFKNALRQRRSLRDLVWKRPTPLRPKLGRTSGPN